MARSAAKRSLMPGLTTSLRWMTPSSARAVGHRERRAAGAGDAVDRRRGIRRAPGPASRPANFSTASTAPLRSRRPPRSTPDRRVCGGEGNDMQSVRRQGSGSLEAELGFGQRDDGAAFRRLVGEAGEQRRFRQLGADRRRGTGRNSVAMRLPKVMVPVLSSSSVSTSPAASTARPEVAMHVEADQAVHAGDADGREQAADGGRDQRDQQRHQHRDGENRAGIDGEARERDHRDQEDQRQARQQDRQRDLVRRLLPLGAFDQRDHAVDEGFAGLRR